MRIQFYQDVYKWLIQLGIVKSDPKNHAVRNNGKVELDESTSALFWSGLKVGDIVQKIDQANDQRLKDNNTPTARLFNWNLLTEKLKRIGVELDSDIKGLIVGGDLEMVSEVVKDIYDLQKQKGMIMDQDVNYSPQRQQEFGITQQWEQQQKSQEILQNIDLMNSAKPLGQTECLLEFILISLSHNLSLKPRQAQQLLNHNNKLLSHICVKGVKGQFQMLINWLADIYSNWAKLINLSLAEQTNIVMLLNVIKPTLLSKDEEVVHWGLRIYTKLSYELANNDLLFHVYQWTVKDNGGFQQLLLSYQRQPQLADVLAGLLLQISRYDMQDFFTHQLQKFFDSSKTALEMYGGLLPYLTQSAKLKENFDETGVLQNWVDQALQLAGSEAKNTRDHKMAGLTFLCAVWNIYSQKLDIDQNLQSLILQQLQKATRDTSHTLNIYSMMICFRLLDQLAVKKAQSAANVYRKLTFILVENYDNIDHRQFLINNFVHIFKKYPSIPLDIIIDPLVKLLQSNHAMNLNDAILFNSITSHQNLKQQSAIMMLDALVRLYNTNYIFAQTIFPSIQKLLSKFIDDPQFQEFVVKISTVSLAIYQASIRNKKQSKVNQNSMYQVDEDSVVNSQKRALIIELMKYIITLRSYSMNQLLKPLVVTHYLELKNIEKQDNKGVLTLLQLLGDPENIVEEVLNNQRSDDLFLDKKLIKLGVEDTRQQDDLQKELEKSFIENTKEQQGEIYLTQKEEEEALMQSLLGNNTGKVPIKSNLKKHANKSNAEYKTSPYLKDEWQCVYEESELAHIEVPQIQIQLISFEDEEDFERESINQIIKDYYKAMRYLFTRYVQTEKQAAKKRLLQQSQFETQTLRISELFRMLSDYEIQDFTSYDEVISLVSIINNKYAQPTFLQDSIIDKRDPAKSRNTSHISESKSRITNSSQQTEKSSRLRLDFDCFQRFLAQFALLIFSRPPRNLKKLPAGQILLELFKFFSNSARRKGDNSLIFDDPEGLNVVADKQTIKKWNMELELHPDLDVPESTHLKKIPVREVTLNFHMKRNVIPQIGETWLMAFEIVNDLISTKFKSSLIEPTSTIKMVQKVKPLHAKGLHKDKQVDILVEKQQSIRNSMMILEKSSAKTKSRFDNLNRSLEMSLSPEMGFYDSKSMAQSTKIMNKHQMLKLVEEQESLLKSELKQQKWQSRKDYLDKQEKKIKAQREQKDQERIKKITEEIDQKLKKVEKKSKKDIDRQEYLDKKREEYRSSQSQLFLTQKEKLEIERKSQKEKEEQKLKTNKDFLKDDYKKVKQIIGVKSEVTQKKRQEETLKPEEEKKKHEQDIEKAKKLAEAYKKLKKLKIDYNKGLKDLYTDPSIQTMYKNFEKAGKKLFNYYLPQSDNENISLSQWNVDAWVAFSRMFNVHPDLMQEAQSRSIFYQTLKSKNHIEETRAAKNKEKFIPNNGLTYHEIEQTFLRLAVKVEEYFNKVQGKDKVTIQTELIDYRTKQAQKPIKEKYEKYGTLMAHLKNTKGTTLEGMFTYLDIPADDILFDARIKSLQRQAFKQTKPLEVPIDLKKVIAEEAYAIPEEDRKEKKEWNIPGSHNKLTEEQKQELEKKEKERKGKAKPFIKRNNKMDKLEAELEKIRNPPQDKKDDKKDDQNPKE